MMAAPQPLPPCVRKLIDAHFRGGIHPEGERRMRAHLPHCHGCRGYYERHLLLEKVDPSGLGPEIRLARGLGLQPRKKALSSWMVANVCATAALLLVALVATRLRPSDGGFAGRGAVSPERAEIFAYRTNPWERLEAHATIRANDEIAFAYTNPGEFRRLLVYGVDEHGHVYWYHPAWVEPMDDPHAIAIAAGPELRELPEAIRHSLAGRELTLHAVFVNEDVSVRRVESLLARSTGLGASAVIDGSYERVLPLLVER
jgi:hypothetical protein